MTRVLHLLLALNVFASATGVEVFEHLCSMRGRTVSVFVDAAGCPGDAHVPTETKSCCHGSATGEGPAMTEQPCCSDTVDWLQADFDATDRVGHSAAVQIAVAPCPVLAKAALPEAPAVASLSEKVVRAMRYKPPCPPEDVRVRVQSFLI